ncbi:MAG: YggT family protein, partial [Treponema sp.]|nr:YggT family protein [Treponema sp.]
MVQTILSILAAVLSLYTFACFIYIIMSWIPGLKFTKFGKIISTICEPYMNLFSRSGLLRIGNIDFSPIISIGLLSLLSSILGGIQATGRIYFGGILQTIIYNLWGIAQSLIGMLFILVLIRWIVLATHHGYTPYESPWSQVDRMLSNLSYKIASTFIKTNISYQKSLLVTWISLLVFLIAGNFIIRLLIVLCSN